MPCLNENILAELAQGLLTEARATEAQTHVAACPECRTILAELARGGLLPSYSDTPEPAQPSEAAEARERAQEPPPLARGQTIGRYIIVDLLGRGGMGVVYSAYDPELDRKVALKVLHAAGDAASPADSRPRPLREAQAMARLSDPHVVAIHDTGTVDGRVFIAMEFVQGVTLRRSLEQRSHSPREVLGLCVRAGRGLVAAHAAGLVHRDFKPENVLVGDDGSVRVTDFGLAYLAPRATTRAAQDPNEDGLVMGTPAYMAPEQLEGGATSAQTDQFAFCVVLYEALYGERPFPGRTLEEITTAVASGVVLEPTPGHAVPAWLRKILLRGLSAAPEERFGSMEALLQALSQDPVRRRYRQLGAMALLALVGSGVGGTVHRRHEEAMICREGGRQLSGIWDGPRQRAIHTALLATGAPYAEETFRGVARLLDAYAAQWTSLYGRTCEGRRKGSAPRLVSERQMQCLEQRRTELASLSSLLAEPDGEIVEHGVQAAAELTRIAECTSEKAAPLLPSDRSTPSKEAEEIRIELARAKVLRNAADARHWKQGLAIAAIQQARAHKLGDRWLEAEALYEMGHQQEGQRRLEDADKTLYQAAVMAESARHEEIAARAWIELVFVLGFRLHRYEDAYRTAQLAHAAIERLGGSEELEVRLLMHVGSALSAQGRLDEAIAQHQRALTLAQKVFGPDDPVLGTALFRIGNTLRARGRYDEALHDYERALAIRERALGANHPAVATTLNSLGGLYLERGDYDTAWSLVGRALSIQERALGPHDAELATMRLNMGEIERHLGHLDKADAYYTDALEGAVRAKDRGTTTSGDCLRAKGSLLAARKQLAEASRTYTLAITRLEAAFGKQNPRLASALTGLAEVDLERGRAFAAAGLAERALTLRTDAEGDPVKLARTQLLLARALAAAHRDPPRARKLALAALATLRASGSGHDPELLQALAWLRRHGR